MKNYRALVPIGMILLMVVSIYSMVSGAVSQAQEIDELLNRAQSLTEQKLYDKAVAVYNTVIEKEDKIEHYLSVVDMYYEAEQLDACKNWCETIMEKFPENHKAYETMVKICCEQEAYGDAYDTIDEFDGRKLSSENIEKYKKEMEYLYYEDSLLCHQVTQSSAGYVGVFSNELWGLATSKGTTIIMPRFNQISYFANEMVAVLDTEGTWYFMNTAGEYMYNISDMLKGNVTDVGLYNAELFPACVDGKYGYYNLNGEKVFGEYDYAGSFSTGIAAVKEGKNWKLINASGKSITEKKFEEIILDDRGICCLNERVFAKLNEEFIMLDVEGNRVGNNSFEGAKTFLGGEYAAVMQDELWGFVDTNGQIVIEPEYQDAKSFSMKLAAVCEKDLWGYIDINNNEIVEIQYVDAMPFSTEGTAFVQDDIGLNILKLYKYNH